MANEDQDLELDVDTEGAASGGKSKLIIIIAVVVLLVGGGLAAFLLMGGDDSSDVAEDAEDTSEVASDEPKQPAQYVGVPEAITSNIAGSSRSRTVQIKMSFMVRSDEAVDAVKDHMPQLKNDILMLVSQQSADELRTPEGRVLLQQKSLETVQKTLTELVGQPMIERVLFISFVMQ